ncbi:helix-turn-helix transcriptional regulator [Streptomyces sp. NPDC048430]|uniref:helix-turn-helix domain-containing protein n=1 Tax=Streptomyces sp. NPDC048430 TaxID=3155388 RepID=UPI00343C35E8
MSDDASFEEIKCQHCLLSFYRRKQTGRRPKYCSPQCRSAAFRTRSAEPTRPEFARETERIGQAVANRARMVAQSSSLPVRTWPLEPLRHSVALQRELDDFIAVAVREALARGADWEEIAAVTSISVSSLKSRFSRAKVNKAVHARRRRRPGRPAGTAAAVPRSVAGERPLEEDAQLWNAHDSLARALSHLHRSSGLSVRAIALDTGISPSYAYRLMAGERSPSWPTVQNFALACDNKPEELFDLWSAASGQPEVHPDVGYDQALSRFQGAIRGLHLAEARPDPATVASTLPDAARHEIPIVESLLTPKPATRAERLSWPATAALTSALHGSHERIRRHWRALRKAAPTPTILTQAFG